MYEKVGDYADSRQLTPLVVQLAPRKCEQGYGTTASAATISVFRPHLRAVFGGEWTYAICSVIWQNGTIPPHQDGDTVTHHSKRFHLVLQSNPQAWVFHGGDWQQLSEGGIYTMNPQEIHAAVNWGQEPRIHLVVDMR